MASKFRRCCFQHLHLSTFHILFLQKSCILYNVAHPICRLTVLCNCTNMTNNIGAEMKHLLSSERIEFPVRQVTSFLLVVCGRSRFLYYGDTGVVLMESPNLFQMYSKIILVSCRVVRRVILPQIYVNFLLQRK